MQGHIRLFFNSFRKVYPFWIRLFLNRYRKVYPFWIRPFLNHLEEGTNPKGIALPVPFREGPKEGAKDRRPDES